MFPILIFKNIFLFFYESVHFHFRYSQEDPIDFYFLQMLKKLIHEMPRRALINQIYLKFAALASMASITSFAKFDSCRIPPNKFAYFSYGLHSKAKHSAVNHIQCTDPEILKIINIGLTLLLVWGRN